jgi:hypothetical protein
MIAWLRRQRAGWGRRARDYEADGARRAGVEPTQRHDVDLRRIGPGARTVFATYLKMRKGPPVTLALSLEKNLRTRSTGVGTYVDTKALADGGLRELRLVQISDNQVLAGLRHYLQHTEDRTTPWRPLVELRGEHAFDV